LLISHAYIVFEIVQAKLDGTWQIVAICMPQISRVCGEEADEATNKRGTPQHLEFGAIPNPVPNYTSTSATTLVEHHLTVVPSRRQIRNII